MAKFIQTFFTVALVVMCCLAPASEAVLSNNLMLLVRPILKYCAFQNDVTPSQLNAIIANDLTVNTKNTQCLSLCFMNKLGMFDMEGNINVRASINSFSFGEKRQFVTEVVNQCKDFKGEDACETASLVYACYVEKKLL